MGILMFVSLSLQLFAAAWAMGLARLTGWCAAWLCLAAAMGLMALRRAITLGGLLAGDDPVVVEFLAEAVALLISILMVATVVSLGPLVKRLQRTEEILRLNEQLRQESDQRRQAQEALHREQRTLKRLLHASDHDRQLIGYEIHDGLAQDLAAAMMHLQIYEAKRHNGREEAERAYRTAVDALRQAHSEARRLISGVRPPILDESGVEAALAALIHDLGRPRGPEIKLQCDIRFDRLPAVLENGIYRIAQQALTNACVHSRSDRVVVSLLQEGEWLHLEVRDWGIGFNPKSVSGNRFGLEGVRERARLLGGNLAIESGAGKGTCLRITIPLVEAAGEFDASGR